MSPDRVCVTCLEGTDGLKKHPHVDRALECSFCRSHREHREYEQGRLPRIEKKLDRILEWIDGQAQQD